MSLWGITTVYISRLMMYQTREYCQAWTKGLQHMKYGLGNETFILATKINHNLAGQLAVLEWGLLSKFPPFNYFPNFSALSKHCSTWLNIMFISDRCHRSSPQLSCGVTDQIWKWFKEHNRYCFDINISLTGKLMNGALVTPPLLLTPTLQDLLSHSE